jgi:hypothetical protein
MELPEEDIIAGKLRLCCRARVRREREEFLKSKGTKEGEDTKKWEGVFILEISKHYKN